jgi:hypothetical protein
MSLFDAARSGDSSVIQSLVDEGADVHKTNYYGYTAVTMDISVLSLTLLSL